MIILPGGAIIKEIKREEELFISIKEELLIDDINIDKDVYMKYFKNLLEIRNWITHNYFFYIDEEIEVINDFIEGIDFKKVYKLLKHFGFRENDKEWNKYNNQGEKFKNEREKIVNPLLNMEKIKNERWIKDIKKLLYLDGDDEI